MLPDDFFDSGLDPTSPYTYPIVGFVGMQHDAVVAFLQTQQSVGRILDMRQFDRQFEDVVQSFDERALRTLRLSWLRNALRKWNGEQQAGLFTVVAHLRTDAEVDELRWHARAPVFQVGGRPESIGQRLPRLHPDRPASFYGTLKACIDPGAFLIGATLA